MASESSPSVNLIPSIVIYDPVLATARHATGTVLTNSTPQHVAIVDGDGTQITSFGGGTQYTEDAAAAANPVGTANILIRTDTPATQVTTDGDNIAQRGTNYGAAYVQLVTSSGSYIDSVGGGTQYTEGDTDASITGTVLMMEVAANAIQPIQGTVADGILVNLGTNNDVIITSGTITTITNSVAVTGTFWQATQPVSGTVTANLSATDNAVLDAIAADTGTIAGDTTSLDAKIPALGQALAAASIPVVLTAAQMTTLTPLATVAVTQSGTWDEVGINDSGNSITVDAPQGTPVFVRLSDGTNPIATLPVSLASVPSHAVTNAGTFAVQIDGDALTSLQLIDNAISGAGFNITQFGGAAVPIGAGLEATAIRVTLPTDGTGKVTVVQGTATNLKTQAEVYQGGSAVAAGNPLQVSLANTGANGTAVKVNVASGGIASGAIASGAIASGAVASGAIASGALASGSISTGAIVDALADDAAFTPATSRVFPAGFEADETTPDSVDEGDIGAARMTLDRKQIATIRPHTSGGWSVMNATSGDNHTALTNSAQVIKASAGSWGGYYIYNPNSSAIYVHVYNVAAASVTVGTTEALLNYCIPATSAANLEIVCGIPFSTAMSWAATTTGGGNTAPTTALEAMALYI